MSALTSAAIDAGMDLAAQDDAGTDAGTQRHQNQALNVLILVVVELSQGGAVRVVAKIYRQVPVFVEHFRHRHGADGDVDGLDHHAPFIIYRAWKAHSHRGHLVTGNVIFLRQSNGHFRQRFTHLLHGFKFQGHFPGRRNLVALVYQPGFQIGPADIDADIIHGIPPCMFL